jgi:hypothetical protein
MTPPRPVPPHGTRARATGTKSGSRPPCHCEPCRRALHRADKTSRVNLQLGRRACIPAHPSTAHLRTLQEAGWPLDAIAKATGVKRSTVGYIARGTKKLIHIKNAKKILGLEPTPYTRPWVIPAVGSTRRLQALLAIGHPLKLLVAEAELGYAHAGKVMLGQRDTVNAATAERILILYTRLRWTPGKSVRAANLARKRGWQTPFAWSDVDMDDPGAAPREEEPDAAGEQEDTALDYQAIHLALAGRSGITLTPGEQAAAVVEGRLRSIPEPDLAVLLGMSRRDVHRIWDSTLTGVRRGGPMPERLPAWHSSYGTAA